MEKILQTSDSSCLIAPCAICHYFGDSYSRTLRSCNLVSPRQKLVRCIALAKYSDSDSRQALVRRTEVRGIGLGRERDIITDVCWILSGAWTFRNSIIKERWKMLPFLSPPTHTQTLPPFYFTQTYQNSGDYVSPVLKAVSLVAASHEAGRSHVLFILIPVADLRQRGYVTNQLQFQSDRNPLLLIKASDSDFLWLKNPLWSLIWCCCL